MKIDFLIAMNDSAHGLAISGHLLSELSAQINDGGVDSSRLSPKSRRDMNLTIYVDCLSPDDYFSWPGESVGLQDVAKCWPKIVKPRGFDNLETYAKFNFQKMHRSSDLLMDFTLGIQDCASYIESRHKIIFGFLNNKNFSENLTRLVRSDPKKFKAENYYKNFYSTPWSQGLVVF